MSGSGKAPKTKPIPPLPKPPPLPDPIPTPQDIDIEAQQRAEDVRKKLRARKGRRGTILTEDVLGADDTEKKSILGG